MAAKKKRSDEAQRQIDLASLEDMIEEVDSGLQSPFLLGVLQRDPEFREPEQEFGRRLLELREGRDMTQSQLAEQTRQYDSAGKGISRAVISLYENGTNRPGLRELRILTEVFKVNPAYLIYGTEDPFDTFLDRHRHSFYRTSDPEFLALLTYSFSKLHHNHRESIMDLMKGLILGWGGASPEDLSDEATETFLRTADELRALLAARKQVP